jgi:hypothetical protein
LISLAKDNTTLCAKVGLKKSHTSIRQLAKSFYLHTTAERQVQSSTLDRSVELVEQRMIERELNTFMLDIGYPPPTKFSSEPKLTNPSAKGEAFRIFPLKNKFSGNRQPGDLSITEFLYTLNHAQSTCELSRAEFTEMMLLSTTGKAHMLLTEWASNGESVETLYHGLLTHYDVRLTPGEAKSLLFSYRIPRTSNLSEAVAHIMDLAGRAASSLPPGSSRVALYNMEATEALLRSLPPAAKITATNLMAQLSAKLNRSATITELNRGLNVFRSSIDEEIRTKGCNPEKEEKNTGKKPFKGKWQKKSANSGPSTLSLTAQTGSPQNASGQQGAQGKGSQPKTGGKGGKGKKFAPKKVSPGLNYCSLCGGVDHVAANGCRNMRDDKGGIVNIMPTHGTCNLCPTSVSPRLNHPPFICPFRPGGPFQTN